MNPTKLGPLQKVSKLEGKWIRLKVNEWMMEMFPICLRHLENAEIVVLIVRQTDDDKLICVFEEHKGYLTWMKHHWLLVEKNQAFYITLDAEFEITKSPVIKKKRDEMPQMKKLWLEFTCNINGCSFGEFLTHPKSKALSEDLSKQGESRFNYAGLWRGGMGSKQGFTQAFLEEGVSINHEVLKHRKKQGKKYYTRKGYLTRKKVDGVYRYFITEKGKKALELGKLI